MFVAVCWTQGKREVKDLEEAVPKSVLRWSYASLSPASSAGRDELAKKRKFEELDDVKTRLMDAKASAQTYQQQNSEARSMLELVDADCAKKQKLIDSQARRIVELERENRELRAGQAAAAHAAGG